MKIVGVVILQIGAENLLGLTFRRVRKARIDGLKNKFASRVYMAKNAVSIETGSKNRKTKLKK